MALNLAILKTPSGYLKLAHLVLGAIALGIYGYYNSSDRKIPVHIILPGVVILINEVFFFLLVTFAFLLTSFALFVTLLFDEVAEVLKNSYFEILYHALGFIFNFAASIGVIVQLAQVDSDKRDPGVFSQYVFGAVCVLLNSLLYLANAVIAFKQRRNNGTNFLLAES